MIYRFNKKMIQYSVGLLVGAIATFTVLFLVFVTVFSSSRLDIDSLS